MHKTCSLCLGNSEEADVSRGEEAERGDESESWGRKGVDGRWCRPLGQESGFGLQRRWEARGRF